MSQVNSKARIRLHRLFAAFVPQSLQELKSDHPAWIAARTYVLSLSLSLGPALVPILTEGSLSNKRRKQLASVLRKELSVSGFAFAMTVAVGGGAAAEYFWLRLARNAGQGPRPKSDHKLPVLSNVNLRSAELNPVYRTFICNAITSLLAIVLMHRRRRFSQTRKADVPLAVPIAASQELADRKSPATLDLTLLLFVRALDSIAQILFLRNAEKSVNLNQKKDHSARSPEEECIVRRKAMELTDKLDAVAFWAASARVMWCFFYRPERLPRSYVRWIGTLANLDERLLLVLRKRKNGTWAYGSEQSHTLLSSMAEDLGYPRSWGDSLLLPARGGKHADDTWKLLGVKGRAGVGGIPCEIVHGGVGSAIVSGGVGGSCTANTLMRGGTGFLEGLAIYTPVHLLPILFTRPRELLSLIALKRYTFALFRSSLFLSVFISSIWWTVCFTRSLGVAKLFPRLSHNFIDGPFGCIMAGCLMCGGSIWIEQGKRRAEIALYVLPRALRTLLSESWLKSGSRGLKAMEQLAFVLSLASILTASRHYPASSRGLSRWTVTFVTKGVPRDY